MAKVDKVDTGDIRGVFDSYQSKVYPFTYDVTLHIFDLHGGIPSDPKMAEGWIRSKIQDKDSRIRELVAQTMIERGLDINKAEDVEKALVEVTMLKHLNGFKRDPDLGLYIEGRQVKAMVREAANVAWPDKRWGPTRKGTKSFIAEHFFVPEKRCYLDREDADDVWNGFVHGRYGSSFVFEEVCYDVELPFTLKTDLDLSEEELAQLWNRAQDLGLGASRSQGFGVFKVVRFDLRKGAGRKARS